MSILALGRHQFCLAGQYTGRSSTSSTERSSNKAYRGCCRGYTGTRANSDSIVPGAIIERQLARPLVPWLHVTSDRSVRSKSSTAENFGAKLRPVGILFLISYSERSCTSWRFELILARRGCRIMPSHTPPQICRRAESAGGQKCRIRRRAEEQNS
jgi:hypothetical protein